MPLAITTEPTRISPIWTLKLQGAAAYVDPEGQLCPMQRWRIYSLLPTWFPSPSSLSPHNQKAVQCSPHRRYWRLVLLLEDASRILGRFLGTRARPLSEVSVNYRPDLEASIAFFFINLALMLNIDAQHYYILACCLPLNTIAWDISALGVWELVRISITVEVSKVLVFLQT